MRCLRCTLFGSMLVVLLGCGGASVFPAGGKVVFKDGTPLNGGVILCEPVDEEVKVSVRGYIGEDGTFRLGTFRDDDGAPAGKYKVRIQPPEKLSSRERERARPKFSIHPRFMDCNTSGLEITVTNESGKNDFTLQVEKP